MNSDGSLAVDVTVNQKAAERRIREAAERAAREAADAAPWSRENIIEELARVEAEGVISIIGGKEVRSSINLHGEDLSGMNLAGLDLSRANLHGAKLVGTNLMGANLTSANLYGADLSDAILTAAKVESANLSDACLCGADVTGASLRKANLSDACVEDCLGLGLNQKLAASPQGDSISLVREKDDSLEGTNVNGVTTVHVPFDEPQGLSTEASGLKA